MKMKIILEGDVQQVGFREYIKKFAIKNRIKGSVRNMDNGSVEIYFLMESDLLDAFRNYVMDKSSRASIENITVIPESDNEFGTPPSDFSKFKVIRDEDEIAETLSIMTRSGLEMREEMHDGFDTLGVKMDHGFNELGKKIDTGFDEMGKKMDHGFNELGKKIDTGFDEMGKKMDHGFNELGNKIDTGFDQMGKKMDHGFNELGNKIDTGFDENGKKMDHGFKANLEESRSMHIDTNARFDKLDEKYGIISKTLLDMHKDFKEYNANLNMHNQKLDDILKVLTNQNEKESNKKQ
jgi:acylphosphatase